MKKIIRLLTLALLTVPVPQMTTLLGPAIRSPNQPMLTLRQSEVIALVASGLGSKQIAKRIGVAPRTIDKHLEDAYRKLGTANRTETVAAWWSLVGRGD